jgi:hypothetical protein
MLLRERCFEHGLCQGYLGEIWRDQDLNVVYRRVTLRVPRMTATLGGMRAIIALALLAVATPAHADSYVGLSGGLAVPLSDDQYTDAVDASPVLGARLGAYPKALGGFFSFDWMIADVENDGALGLDFDAHRFRLLVGPELHHPVSNTLGVTARAGIGLDIVRSTASGNLGPIAIDESETDLGLGFEFAGGVWFGFGGVQVGGEVSLPISMHDDDPNENDYDFDYTSVDLQLMVGVRFMSR